MPGDARCAPGLLMGRRTRVQPSAVPVVLVAAIPRGHHDILDTVRRPRDGFSLRSAIVRD